MTVLARSVTALDLEESRQGAGCSVPSEAASALTRSQMALAPAVSQSVTIPGPAGTIEAVLDTPPTTTSSAVGVICHPHPLHGGTMTNKVVHTLAKAFNDVGAPAVRFNY